MCSLSWTVSQSPSRSTATAVENNDLAALTALLDEGRRRKEEVDGR